MYDQGLNIDSHGDSPVREDEAGDNEAAGEDDEAGDNEPGAENDGDRNEEPLQKKHRKPRVKLDIAFFRGEPGEESQDKLWDLFLDVVEPFSTFKEQQLQSTLDESNQISFHRSLLHSLAAKDQPRRGEEEAQKRDRRLRAVHLDSLLKKIRNWEQNEYPYGLSMHEFGRRMHKVTQRSEFLDYRADLIHKYKTSDWRKLSAERRRAQRKELEKTDENIPTGADTASVDSHNATQESIFMQQQPLHLSSEEVSVIAARREAYIEALQRKKPRGGSGGISPEIKEHVQVTETQHQIIEENRKKALEKRMAKLQLQDRK